MANPFTNPPARGAAPRTPHWVKGQSGDPSGYLDSIVAAVSAGGLVWPDPIGLQSGGGVIREGRVRAYWIDAEGGTFVASWQGQINRIKGTTQAELTSWAAENPTRSLSRLVRLYPGVSLTSVGVRSGTLPGGLQWYAPTDADLAAGQDQGSVGLAQAPGGINPLAILALIGGALIVSRLG